jgi:hypothetical protein
VIEDAETTEKTEPRERCERVRAVERLVALSTRREALIEWHVLERIDELAWSN